MILPFLDSSSCPVSIDFNRKKQLNAGMEEAVGLIVASIRYKRQQWR